MIYGKRMPPGLVETCILLLSGVGICFAFESKVLMLIKRGGGSNFKTLWDKTGGENDVSGKCTWSLTDILEAGSFRSAEVDDWPSNPPTEVSLVVINARAEIHWWVTFEVKSSSKKLEDWFKEDDIIESYSEELLQTNDRRTGINNGDHMIFIYYSLNSEHGWLTVEDKNPSPKIRFVRNYTLDSSFSGSGGSWWAGLIIKTLGTTGMEFMVDLSADSDSQNSPIFLRKQVVQVRKGLFSYKDNRYNFYYSQQPCGLGNMTGYTDETGTLLIFTSKVLQYTIDTIAVWCFKVVLLDPIQSGYTVYFSGTAETDPFVEAHAIAVVAGWNEESPTTSSTQASTVQSIEVSQMSQVSDVDLMTSNSYTTEASPIDSTLDNTPDLASGSLYTTSDLSTSPSVLLTTGANDYISPSEQLTLATDVSTSPSELLTTEANDYTSPSEPFTLGTDVSMSPFVQLTTGAQDDTSLSEQLTLGTLLSTSSSVQLTTAANDYTPITVQVTIQTNEYASISPTHVMSSVTGAIEHTDVFSTLGLDSTVASSDTTTQGESSVSITNLSISTSCQCPCISNTSDMSLEELELSIKILRRELTLNKTQLSNYQRKLISAEDNRPSAKRLGYVGVLVLTATIGGLVCLDIKSFAHVFTKIKYKLVSKK